LKTIQKTAIPKLEWSRRRRQLMRLMGRDSIAILPAAPVRHRNNDVEYAYRQDSDFYYITGFAEPEAVAVLIPGREQAQYVMFVRERDPSRETWDGKRAGPAGAARDYGADDAFPISDIDEIIPGLLENRAKVFYTMGLYPEFDQRVVSWVNGLRTQARNGRHPPPGVRGPRSRAPRHAPVQIAHRNRADARISPDCFQCACASDALHPAGAAGVRGHGGARSRVPAI
jgi:hypothetical protein